MYTNPHNIFLTLKELLEANAASINQCVHVFQPKRSLTLLEGIRNTLPESAYPSFEIEATTGANQWATTRAQRPRYELSCMLTTRTQAEKLHHEYITTLATRITEIMTSPENLQLQVENESRWDPTGGLVGTFFTDSLVENVSYSAQHEGTIRVAEFAWFALIHEPFPESKWDVGSPDMPTILRPKVV